jgi:hypothetical protein
LTLFLTLQWAWIAGNHTFPDGDGFYGSRGTASTTNLPPARQYTTAFIDSSDFFVFAGSHFSETDRLQDIWKYTSGITMPSPTETPNTGSAPTAAPTPLAGPIPSLAPLGAPQAVATPTMSPTAPCAGSPPANSFCFNNGWTAVVSSVIIAGNTSTYADFDQPISVPGNFSVLNPRAVISISVPVSGLAIQVDGCATFSGNLILIVRDGLISSNTRIKIISFRGGCSSGGV